MTVTDVNQLVIRFEQAAKMMKTVARGGMPQIPGMGPIPGAGGYGGGKRQAAKGKKKSSGSRSGNPAKRAAENAAIASGVAPTGAGLRARRLGLRPRRGCRRRQAGAERGGARRHAEVPRPVELGAHPTGWRLTRAGRAGTRVMRRAGAPRSRRAGRSRAPVPWRSPAPTVATAGSPDAAIRASAISRAPRWWGIIAATNSRSNAAPFSPAARSMVDRLISPAMPSAWSCPVAGCRVARAAAVEPPAHRLGLGRLRHGDAGRELGELGVGGASWREFGELDRLLVMHDHGGDEGDVRLGRLAVGGASVVALVALVARGSRPGGQRCRRAAPA